MWKSVYESVCGTSHKNAGLPCQDTCRVVELSREDGTILLICSADGAGSASHAADGAAIACDTFVQTADRHLRDAAALHTVERSEVLSWCQELRSAIDARAFEVGIQSREFASTFLGALVGDSAAVFFQIGDGAIVTCDGNSYRPVFWPQSGEFANSTNFLTDVQFEDRVEWQRWTERVDELAVFSDGLERLALRFVDQTVHSPFLTPMFAALRTVGRCDELFEPLRDFLNSARVNDRTDDDKTLVLATRLNQHKHEDALR